MRFLDVGVSLLDQEKHRKHSISVQEESWQIYSAIQIFEIRSIHGSSYISYPSLQVLLWTWAYRPRFNPFVLDGQPAINYGYLHFVRAMRFQ